jgi:Fe-S cluster assembly iron-binding protein IscA
MLKLTPQAIDHLLRVRREKGLDTDAIPRFVRKAGRLGLTFARRPASGDRVVDDGRLSTLVASSASDLLDAATIDVRTEEGRSVLVVRRAKAGSVAAHAQG